MRRGKLGEQEAAAGREVLSWVERGWRLGAGEDTEKAPPPKSSWKESGILEIATRTKLKREKGERRGLKSH